MNITGTDGIKRKLRREDVNGDKTLARDKILWPPFLLLH